MKTRGQKLILAAVIALLILPAAAPFLRSKVASGHDVIAYLPRLVEFHENIRHGIYIPRWAPDLSSGYGQPFFIFNPPLLCYLAEVFHLAGFSFVNAINASCVLLMLIAGMAMFGYAGRFFGSWGGFVSAVAYVYAPYVLADLYVRCALSEYSAFALYPLVLWSFYNLSGKRTPGRCVMGGVCYGALLLCHNAASLMFTPLLLAYALFLSFCAGSVVALLYALAGMLMGLLLSAFFWLPMLAESGYVKAHLLLAGYEYYGNHFLYLRQLLYSPWGYGFSVPGPADGMSFQTGAAHIALSGVAAAVLAKEIAAAPRGTDRDAIRGHICFFIAAALVAAFMTHHASSWVWVRLRALHYMAFPWRFMSLVALATSFLSGAAALAVGEGRRRAAVAVGSAAMILALNFSHARPERWYDVRDSDYSPERIAGRSVAVTAKGECEPVWFRKKPRSRAVKRISVLKGDADATDVSLSPACYRAEITARENSIIRINTCYFPGWRVLLDGRPVAVEYRNPYRAMDLVVPPGAHRLEATFADTPVRMLGKMMSAGGCILTAFALFGACLPLFSGCAQRSGASDPEAHPERGEKIVADVEE